VKAYVLAGTVAGQRPRKGPIQSPSSRFRMNDRSSIRTARISGVASSKPKGCLAAFDKARRHRTQIHMTLAPRDWLIVVTSLVSLIGMGIVASRPVKDTKNYFLGKRRFGSRMLFGRRPPILLAFLKATKSALKQPTASLQTWHCSNSPRIAFRSKLRLREVIWYSGPRAVFVEGIQEGVLKMWLTSKEGTLTP
jgi:hypothetical protein